MLINKAAEIERLLARPDPALRVVLFFGPDAGLVVERGQRLAQAVAGDDPLAVQRFESDELAATPGRLADEAYGGSLFAGNRAIRVRVGGLRQFLPSVEPLLAQPPADAWVILEAGDLKKTAPLRRACEQAKTAAAIGCYGDGDVGRLIDEEMAAAELRIDADARQELAGLLGDRIASRSEIRKLALYAAGTGTVTVADVRAVVGDGAAVAVDEIVDAAASGDMATVDLGLQRLAAAGTAAFTAASAAERHFQNLHRARSTIDGGEPVAAVLGAFRPPLFFSRRSAVEAQLRLWPRAGLEWAMERLHRAVIDTRLRPANDQAVVGEALGAIAVQAARLRARR